MAVMCISPPTLTAIGYSGEVLRYDTLAEFGTAEAWMTYDLPTQSVWERMGVLGRCVRWSLCVLRSARSQQ